VKGILWRGHANQGRCQPGRRAVLEETKEPSDRRYSTPNASFSQAKFSHKHQVIAFIFSLIELASHNPLGGSAKQLSRYLEGGFLIQNQRFKSASA
jgi:hypothetical protein